METAAIWLRWTRAGTVATVATLLAVAAHLHADGDTPSLPATFLLISFLTAVSATFLARPASTLRVVLLTVGGQLVAHNVLTATSVHPARASVAPTMSAGMPGMTGHPAGHMVEHGVTGAPGSPPLLSELFGLDPRMMAAHLMAAVLVGLWLAAGERAVWTLLTHIWRALRVPALLLPVTPVPDNVPARGHVGVTLVRLGSGSVVRRGPPHLLAPRQSHPPSGWTGAMHRVAGTSACSVLPGRPGVHPGELRRPMTQLDTRPSSDPDRPRATSGTRPAAGTRPGSGGWFRAVWRWHFFASIIIVPVLLVLATTGLIYLFRFQLEPLLHPDLLKVERPTGMDFQQPYSAQLDSAQRAYPDATLGSIAEPRSAERPTVINAEMPDGTVREIYVNPWGADVLGSMNPDTTLSGYAVRLHADLMSGVWGDRLMELGACWALVSALMGYYLLWRGRRARARKPKSLRSWHARVGAVAGIGLLTLLVSGLPWTGFWGGQVQELATKQNTSMWSLDHGAESDPASTLDESLPHSHAVPWGAGKTEVPRSDSEDHEGAVANVDTAIEVAAAEGLRHPMTVALPDGEDGVFSAIGYAFDAPSDERTVHVDRFGGQVVSTYGYHDYPLLAKVVSQGIGLHEGRSLGLVNFWASATMCLLVIASCVTGPLMWWRRRRRGAALGAPRGRMPLAGSRWLLVGLVALGILLPFFGITLLAVLLLDQLVVRRVPALAGWFNTQ